MGDGGGWVGQPITDPISGPSLTLRFTLALSLTIYLSIIMLRRIRRRKTAAEPASLATLHKLCEIVEGRGKLFIHDIRDFRIRLIEVETLTLEP